MVAKSFTVSDCITPGTSSISVTGMLSAQNVFTGYLPGAAAPGTGLDLCHIVLLSKIVQPIGLVRL